MPDNRFLDSEESLRTRLTRILPGLYSFGGEAGLRRLKLSENYIYRLDLREGQSLILRVHRPRYHTDGELQAELQWMAELKEETDLRLPEAIPGRNGELLQHFTGESGEEYRCSVVSFLEGTTFGDLSREDMLREIRDIGGITARLHLQAERREYRGRLDRPAWDGENLFGRNGIWGNWRDYPDLTEKDRRILEAAEGRIRSWLDQYGRTPEHYGMIHGDLHFYNIIHDETGNQLIDFDDCGYGFYLYDLGCTLCTCSEDLEELSQAWVSGYMEYRQLSREELRALPVFILLRRMMRLAWIGSHQESDTVRTVPAEYKSITVRMAEEVL